MRHLSRSQARQELSGRANPEDMDAPDIAEELNSNTFKMFNAYLSRNPGTELVNSVDDMCDKTDDGLREYLGVISNRNKLLYVGLERFQL